MRAGVQRLQNRRTPSPQSYPPSPSTREPPGSSYYLEMSNNQSQSQYAGRETAWKSQLFNSLGDVRLVSHQLLDQRAYEQEQIQRDTVNTVREEKDRQIKTLLTELNSTKEKLRRLSESRFKS